jgi:signal transduction histidine kinase
MHRLIRSLAPSRERRWWLYALGWGVVAAFFTSEWLLFNAFAERPRPWPSIITIAFTDWGVRAVVAIPVVWLAQRVPLRRGRLDRALLVHLPASAAFTLVKVGICYALERTFAYLPTEAFNDLLLGELHLDLFTYWIVVGAVHGMDAYRRYREREREAAELTLRASRLETQLAQAQLDSLKSQLHPHFLFNALHSVSALIHEDVEAADRILARVSEFLRLVLDRGAEQEVPLADELWFLEMYFDIQRARFQGRICIEVDVAPGVDAARVPPLVLQPLVENAVRHAIEPRATGGRIAVRARRERGALVLEVEDDGPGPLPQAGEGLGLANTRARLKQLYGSAASLALESRPEGGALARVRLPFRPDGSVAASMGEAS